jgi:hypothetical protein
MTDELSVEEMCRRLLIQAMKDGLHEYNENHRWSSGELGGMAELLSTYLNRSDIRADHLAEGRRMPIHDHMTADELAAVLNEPDGERRVREYIADAIGRDGFMGPPIDSALRKLALHILRKAPAIGTLRESALDEFAKGQS